MIRRLTDFGIGCAVHYPVPIHMQEAYRSLGYEREAFPIAGRCARQFVSLPVFPELTTAELETVVQGVKEAVGVGA